MAGMPPDAMPALPTWLRALSRRHGDRTLIVLGGRRLSYAAADSASAALARALLAAGVGKGTRVGLLFPNGPEWVLGWLAAARIGAVVVPCNTFHQARELGWTLRHADVDTLLTTARHLRADYLERVERFAPDLAGQRPPLRSRALPFLRRVWVWGGGGRSWAVSGEAAMAGPGAEEPRLDDGFLQEVEREVTPADPMVIVYSSGSTAQPKGAVHTHGALLRHAANLNAQRDLVAEDRIYASMPFFWVGGLVFTLLCAMEAGACLVTEERFDPGETLALLERERVTIAAGWPHLGKALKEHPSFPTRDLSAIRSGSLHDLLRGPAAADPALRHGSLGMTETAGPHTFARQDEPLPEALRGAFGRAVPGVEHKVVDPETGQRLGPGASGEICVRGISVMQGLYKREREEVFDADGFYHTGDAGFFSEDGILFFEARLGELIKTAGANVAPRDVELALLELPQVKDAHVVGLPHPERGQEVTAAVVLREGAKADADVLREALRKELAAYEVPRRFFFVEAAELPFTDTGKLDRRRLQAWLAERRGDGGG